MKPQNKVTTSSIKGTEDRRKLTMITHRDYLTALRVGRIGVDMALVSDSRCFAACRFHYS